jgi:hypothetical protein
MLLKLSGASHPSLAVSLSHLRCFGFDRKLQRVEIPVLKLSMQLDDHSSGKVSQVGKGGLPPLRIATPQQH